ncbi:zinc knuckle CX2CX4HX4C containing protein [Tanacetum coccineum]
MAARDVSNPSSVLQSLSGSNSSILAGTTHPKSDIVSDVNEGDWITELFGISFATPKDIYTFTSNLESGKYRVLSELTRDKRQEVMNTISSMWNKLVVEKTDASVSALQSIPQNDITVSEFFSVSFETLVDINDLTRDIETGKYEALLSQLTVERRNEVIEDVFDYWKSFEDNSPNNLNFGIVATCITKSTSYAGAAVATTKAQPQVNSIFRPLVVDPVFNGVNIFIPHKVVKKVSARLEHTLYGYFIGKRLAFPVVEYYARQNWGKHGLKIVMMNTNGFFSLNLIQSLLKDELTRIPIWVKLHDIPLQVFEEDGISLIATFIGKPIMLDSYTSSMCKDSWGRSSFARFLIEINSEADLVDVVTIGIPSLTGDDFTKETIRVDPPIVTTSNVVAPTVKKSNDGFQMVGKKKKRKGKSKSTNGGQLVGPFVKQTVRYEPKAIPSTPKKETTNVSNPSKSSSVLKTAETSPMKVNFTTSNSFFALNDEEEVENVCNESANLFKTGGSSSFTAVAG